MELLYDLPFNTITPTQENLTLPLSSSLLKKSFDEQGLLLLRGFELSSVEFKKVSEIFCDKFFVSGLKLNRRLIDDKDCYTVPITNWTILGHSEGDYKPADYHPRFCFFGCLIPPSEVGGQTVIVDGVQFLEALSSKTREKFKNNRTIYDMVWNKERWESEFSVTSIQALKAHLDNIPNVTYTINEETLHMRYKKSAIRSVRIEGVYRETFSNSILALLPKINHPRYTNLNVYSEPTTQLSFENGEKFSDEMINELIETYDKLSYLHAWKKNDVLIIDNTRYLHGRVETKKACVRHILCKFGF